MRKKAERIIIVNDKMQKNYRYVLTESAGKNFAPEFQPELTPKQMLALGVFCGVYLRDCRKEFPKDWFSRAKLAPPSRKQGEAGKGQRDCQLNYFKIDASLPLKYWQKKGWIYPGDPRGWFQWYCRYYLGRRIPDEDARQIKRWRAIKRHIAQIQKNCHRGDIACRRKQRQAVLHWAYDSRKI